MGLWRCHGSNSVKVVVLLVVMQRTAPYCLQFVTVVKTGDQYCGCHGPSQRFLSVLGGHVPCAVGISPLLRQKGVVDLVLLRQRQNTT